MIVNLLAHGTLGNWDEMIFLGVSVIFVVMMGISWVRSRNIEPEFDDIDVLKTSVIDNDGDIPASADESDRFRLD